MKTLIEQVLSEEWRLGSLLSKLNEGNVSFDPKNIYDFYALEYTFRDNRNGKDLSVFLFTQIKREILHSFTSIVVDQLTKYQSKRRYVGDMSKSFSGQSLGVLLKAMQQTRRSDMVRNNEKWEALIQKLILLENSNSVKDMILNIDGIYNLTHNTGESMLSKFVNHRELLNAFNFCRDARDIKQYKGLVSQAVEEFISGDVDSRTSEGLLMEGFGKNLALAGVLTAGAMIGGVPQVDAAQHQHASQNIKHKDTRVDVTNAEISIDRNKLLQAIKQVESSNGIDKKDRYESGVEKQLRDRFSKLGKNTQSAIKQYGFKRVATSYGPYQILASTAYDLGYEGTPEGLRDETINKAVVSGLLSTLIGSKKTQKVEDVISAYNAGLGRIGTNLDYINKVMKLYKSK